MSSLGASSSPLVSYSQDVDYTRAARNDPNAVYPSAETMYQAVKGPGCTLRSLNSLSLDDFISSGAITAHCRLKHLSLAPYYAAQMKRCMQKWDRRDNQGSSSEAINVSQQSISMVGTGIYHSMADVQYMVRSNCGSVWLYPLINLLRPMMQCTVRTTQ